MPEDLPGRMPEDMPHRMSEDMPDRYARKKSQKMCHTDMPEDKIV